MLIFIASSSSEQYLLQPSKCNAVKFYPFLNDYNKDENNKNVHIQVISTHKSRRKNYYNTE
jgi:hypothetical protein